jgi:hypothetical protein
VDVSLNSQKSELSDVMLANVEALATESSNGQQVTCYNTISGQQGSPMEDKTYCGDCKSKPAQTWSNVSECSR